MSELDKWNPILSLHKWPSKKQPAWDYYWDYGKEEWIQVHDDDDMSWVIERLLGYDSYPGYKDPKCKENTSFSGREWKESRPKTLPKKMVFL